MFEMTTNKYNWVSVVCMIITIIFTFATYYRANEHPPIYDTEIVDFYTNNKASRDVISKKLSTGNYAVLAMRSLGLGNAQTGGQGDKYVLVLGKIKKIDAKRAAEKLEF